LTILVEVTSFTLMALLVARLGTAASASHQIASNLAAILYMAPLALGIATSARVSFWRGAADARRARAAWLSGLRITLVASVGVALLCGLLRDQIASAYSSDPALAALAASLLAWVAWYHPADALQGMSIFVLRSYRLTVAPMLVYSVLLWGVGLGGGYLLCYEGLLGLPAMHTPKAFWIASAVAVTLTAALFTALLGWAAHRSLPANGSPGTP
jgi:MATE family multidrug resistance protein